MKIECFGTLGATNPLMFFSPEIGYMEFKTHVIVMVDYVGKNISALGSWLTIAIISII